MLSLAMMLVAGGTAQAWELTGWVWAPHQLPIEFYQTDYNEDSLPQAVNPDTDRIYQEDVIIKGFCNWHWTEYCDEALPPDWERYPTADCADFSYLYGGRLPGNEGATGNGQTKIYWDDPNDSLGSGVNAVTTTRASSVLVRQQGEYYLYEVFDSDITFNNDIPWGTTEDIEDGCTGDLRGVEATGTHEIGHLLGMAHSCEQNEACTDDAKLTATMYWTGSACDTSRNSINSDDIEGINALYGPYVQFSAEADTRFGQAPLEVCFNLDVNDETWAEITSVNWRFGDGVVLAQPGDEPLSREICHDYESQGQFTVSAEFSGASDVCGEWDSVSRQLAYVLVCDVPIPDFDLEPSDGLIYQVVNKTNVDTYGCVDGINYAVYEGGNTSGEPIMSIGAWSPLIEFPAEGAYTVVLTAQGPAGEAQFELAVDIEERRAKGSGCSSMPFDGFGLAGLALVFGALLARRRED